MARSKLQAVAAEAMGCTRCELYRCGTQTVWGDGPANAIVALGCAGWGAGQLEQELVENSWLTVPADAELLFTLPLPLRWQASAGRLGVDLAHMADYSGHA